MRPFIVAGLFAGLALLGSVSTGTAQSRTSDQPVAPSVPTPQPGPAPIVDPRWTAETGPYHPCPADVVMRDGRHDCLGMPSYPGVTYRWHRRVSWRKSRERRFE
jgi:hypothetical protein